MSNVTSTWTVIVIHIQGHFYIDCDCYTSMSNVTFTWTMIVIHVQGHFYKAAIVIQLQGHFYMDVITLMLCIKWHVFVYIMLNDMM